VWVSVGGSVGTHVMRLIATGIPRKKARYTVPEPPEAWAAWLPMAVDTSSASYRVKAPWLTGRMGGGVWG
jgi:hypothetical protein